MRDALNGQVTISLIELNKLRDDLEEATKVVIEFKKSDRCFLLEYGYRNSIPRIIANGENEIKKYCNDLISNYYQDSNSKKELYEKIAKQADEIKILKTKIPWWRKINSK